MSRYRLQLALVRRDEQVPLVPPLRWDAPVRSIGVLDNPFVRRAVDVDQNDLLPDRRHEKICLDEEFASKTHSWQIQGFCVLLSESVDHGAPTLLGSPRKAAMD